MDIKEHRAACVGVIRDVDPAAGELPDEPGIDRAEEELSGCRPSARAGDVVQEPLDLGAGEVGVGDEAGLGPDLVGMSVRHQLVDDVGGAAALPDDGIVDGLAGLLVPDDGGLALVGDADGGDILRAHVELCHGSVGHLVGGVPDLFGVMLHPAGLGENLPELLVHDRTDIAGFVKEDAAAAGGALVERHDVLHGFSSCVSFYEKRISLINCGR